MTVSRGHVGIASSARRLRGCLLACLTVVAAGSRLLAQAPPMMSEELLRKWDLNRDGKIDAAEAETARSQMRRARNEVTLREGTDPVSGKPRGDAAAATSSGAMPGAGNGGHGGSTPDGAGELILVPGTGEPGPAVGREQGPPEAVQPRREREPLPGTRAPATTPPIPSVAPSRTLPEGFRSRGSTDPAPAAAGDPSRDLSSRARILPNGAAVPQPAGRQPLPPPQLAPRPGIIAGGARPTAPTGRSLMAGQPQDLNAGRLPAGLPQTRGVVPGATASGPPSAPRIPGQPLGGGPGGTRGGYPSAGMASPGASPPRSVPQSQYPAAGAAASSRAGGRAPVAQPTVPPRSTTPAVPRPPRVGPQDFYGR